MNKDIIDSGISFFRAYRILTGNAVAILSDEFINEAIAKFEIFLINSKKITLNDDEKEDLIKSIKSLYNIKQEEGYAIINFEENHDYKWFENLDCDHYYWNRYKNYLIEVKHFSPNVIEVLEKTTMKDLMSYIGNPNENIKFSIRGLVVGDVQSGKTSNYLGLIANAADAGYKVIIVLTGMIEGLRRQTQIRIEEGFVGYDSVNSEYVGVKNADRSRTPTVLTSRIKDFTDKDNQNTAAKISENKEPIVFIIKKNVSVLKKVYRYLKNINITNGADFINSSLLLVDDEADNASVNTNKLDYDPTKINDCIRKLLKLFIRNTYVGFTATPFANVFISYDSDDEMLSDDLFPRNFIYSLNSPTNYCGPQKYFVDDNNYIKIIKEENCPLKLLHKKESYIEYLPKDTCDAIDLFILANAIRDAREDNKNTHRSMLINMSRFKDVQFRIAEKVEDYVKYAKTQLKHTSALLIDRAFKNDYVANLKDTFNKFYKDKLSTNASFNDIFGNLYDSCKDIKVVIVNSSKNSTKLNYQEHEKNGLRIIAVGGLALSRGLTLEGLVISYFYRNTKTSDVLLQMGRWFGYRDNYDDLVRIFMTEQSKKYYGEIYESIELLKDDIRKMSKNNVKPEDYGIRVRASSLDLKITSSNKMRNTESVIRRESFYGGVFESVYIYKDLDINIKNYDLSLDFINKIPTEKLDVNSKYPYFRNIDAYKVCELMEKVSFPKENKNFDVNQIINFVKKEYEKNKNFKFDVYVIGGSGENQIYLENIKKYVNCVTRSFDLIYDNKIVRMNGNKARLCGRSDTKAGLTKEQISSVESKCNANQRDYLNYIPNRNPLLIFYFIMPKKDLDVGDDDFYDQIVNYLHDFECYFNTANSRSGCLVGLALGFPGKSDLDGKEEEYIVNTTVNYYDKEHEEDEFIDGDE